MFPFAVVAADKGNQIDCGTAIKTTLDHYNDRAQEYSVKQAGVSPKVDAIRKTFLSEIQPRAEILEVGAAHGRDTIFFVSRGHRVVPVEPSAELANILEKRIALKVDRRPVQELDYENRFGGIYSMATLHHIPTAELPKVFQILARAATRDAFIHASFVMGVGTPDVAEIDEKGRYWSRVSEKTLREILSQIPELQIIESLTKTERDDYHGPRAPSKEFGFFNLFLRKIR